MTAWRQRVVWMALGWCVATVAGACGSPRNDGPDSGPPLDAGVEIALRAPAVVQHGDPLPIWASVTSTTPRAVSGTATIQSAGQQSLLLRYGQGAVLGRAPTSGDQLTLSSPDVTASASDVRLLAAAQRSFGGTLPDASASWGPDELIDITSDLTVPANVTLQIAEGTTVRIAAGANLLLSGGLQVQGSASKPVAFVPAGSAAWGGIVINAGSATFEYALISGGGDDDSRSFGHSNSQPVVFAAEGTTLRLQDSLIADCPGKALGARRARVEIMRSLITRTDTGGEFEYSWTTITDSHFTDFPDIGAPAADDDNDALYFLGALPDGAGNHESQILDSTFVSGLDDGIDHNGATLRIERAWIEGFTHEGVAGSNDGPVFVSDSVLLRNGQGLEAGYGSPDVRADHVLLIDNAVGARFGDSYTREYNGTLTITNAVFLRNDDHQVWNFLLSTNAPAENAVFISHSLIPGGHEGTGNLDAAATLDDTLQLSAGSPGQGAGSDGLNPGLLTARQEVLGRGL